jgi:hypothetical protein
LSASQFQDGGHEVNDMARGYDAIGRDGK